MKRFFVIMTFSFVLCGSEIALNATAFQPEEHNVYEAVIFDNDFSSEKRENLYAFQEEEEFIEGITLRGWPDKPGDVPIDNVYVFWFAAILLSGLRWTYNKRKKAP